MAQPKHIQPLRSAVCDWFIIVCLATITGILESPKSSPYHQCVPGWTKVSNSTSNDSSYIYPCGKQYDPDLEYPYKSNTISSAVLLLSTFGSWIFTFIINTIILYFVERMYKYKHRTVLKNIEILSRMLMFSACGTEALVSIIKFSIGRPRPNFYALMDDSRTENDHKQARMSFPSGHSSLAFSVLFLLSLNLFSAMQYVQIRWRKHKKSTIILSINNLHSYFYLQLWWMLRYYLLLSILIVCLPTFLAVYISCTRVTDYWHHYGDVIAGSLLGIAGATLSFSIYRDGLYSLNVDYKQNLGSDMDSNIERGRNVTDYSTKHPLESNEYDAIGNIDRNENVDTDIIDVQALVSNDPINV